MAELIDWHRKASASELGARFARFELGQELSAFWMLVSARANQVPLDAHTCGTCKLQLTTAFNSVGGTGCRVTELAGINAATRPAQPLLFVLLPHSCAQVTFTAAVLGS